MIPDKTNNTQQFHAYAGTGNRTMIVDSTGLVSANIEVITGKLSDATAISLLTTDSNWNSAGAYIGTAITGTYEGMYYEDTDYRYDAYSDNAWTRKPKTSDTAFGVVINKATEKTTPVDADMVGLMDSAASNILKKLSWANIKATLKSYFDTLYKATFTENTAFNKNFETSTANIKMDGSVSVGTLDTIARADHTHASDTTKANITLSIVSITGTDSLEASDNGKIIELNSSSTFTLTLPELSTGFNCTIVNINTGDVTLAAGSGVTLNYENTNRKLATQWRSCSVYYRSSTSVVLIGNLEA